MANKDLEIALKIAAQTSGKKEIGLLVDELDNISTSSKSADSEAGKLAKELEQLSQQQNLINSFQQSAQALEKQELATIAAANGLRQLEKEAQDSTKPFVDLARSIDAAEKDLTQMRGELGQQTTKHKRLQNALKKSGISTENLSAKKRELAAGFTRVGKKVDAYTVKLKQGSAAERQHGQNLGNISGRIVALTAGYIGLNQVGSALTDLFSTGDKFERLGIQMDALMGSIDGGETATAWVKEFTKNTPLQLTNVSEAFVKLKSFGLDPMDGTLQAITDQAFKLGGSFQEVEGISLALGQAWAKQKLQGEEILQLIERGVPVWDLLEKATGKNTLELQKLSTAGKLGRDTIKALIEEMGKGSVGAAANNMSLLSGMFSNAKDNLDNFYDRITNSGAMDYLKAQIDGLNKTFDQMVKDGRLDEWAQSISDTIVATAEGIKSTFSTIYEYREEIAAVAKAYIALKVGSYFTNVVSGSIKAIGSLATYRAGIAATTVATNKASVATLTWGNTLKTALKGAGLVAALNFTITQFTRVYDATKGLLKANGDLSVSQGLAADQSRRLGEHLKSLSNETGINIKSLDQYFKLIDKGTLVFDTLSAKYINIEQQQRNLAEAARANAEAEKQRQTLTALTLQQALETTKSLAAQSGALNNVRGGVEGFITAIDSAKATLLSAGEQYSDQIALLDQLKLKYESQNESLTRQAFLAGDLNAAYKVLGLESSKALEELAEKQRAAFEFIEQAGEPLEQQQLAFLKWADSAVKAADATGKMVPESVRAAAATLGLTEELGKLIAKQQQLSPSIDGNSAAVNRFKNAMDKTKAAIEQNELVIASSAATDKVKAQAQEALTSQQQKLKQETQSLTKVQQLEQSTLAQLQQEKQLLSAEMERLNAKYQAGAIDAATYNAQKVRLNDLLGIANGLLGEFSRATDQSTRSTLINANAFKTSLPLIEGAVSASQRLALANKQQSNGGANVAFQKLWNEAHERSIQLYDLSALSLDELRDKTKALGQELSDSFRDQSWSLIFKPINDLNNAAKENELRAIEQEKAYRDLFARLDSGSVSIQELDHYTREATSHFDQLSNTKLTALQSQIESARNATNALSNELTNTITSLRNELDQLEGNEQAILKRDFEADKAELEQKLKAAQAAGDRNAIDTANEALAIQNKIYNLRTADVKEKNDASITKKAVTQQNTQKKQQSSLIATTPDLKVNTETSSDTSKSTNTNNVKQTVRLELIIDGQEFKADLLEQFEDAFLRKLEHAKSVS